MVEEVKTSLSNWPHWTGRLTVGRIGWPAVVQFQSVEVLDMPRPLSVDKIERVVSQEKRRENIAILFNKWSTTLEWVRPGVFFFFFTIPLLLLCLWFKQEFIYVRNWYTIHGEWEYHKPMAYINDCHKKKRRENIAILFSKWSKTPEWVRLGFFFFLHSHCYYCVFAWSENLFYKKSKCCTWWVRISQAYGLYKWWVD